MHALLTEPAKRPYFNFNFNLATCGSWLPYWTATALEGNISSFNQVLSSTNIGSLPRARIVLGSGKSATTRQSHCPHDAYRLHGEIGNKHKKVISYVQFRTFMKKKIGAPGSLSQLSVQLLISALVIISQFMRLSPTSSSTLTVQSPLGILSLPLCSSSSCTHADERACTLPLNK